MYYKNSLILNVILGTNQRTTRLKTPKLDKYDEYLKCLANPQLLYHNNAEDPFLKM